MNSTRFHQGINPEPVTQVQKISNALQGFGAGIGGYLPQHQQMMQQRERQQQAMLEKRRQAAWQDVARVNIAVEGGNWEGVHDILSSRREALRNHPDADTSDTDRVWALSRVAANPNAPKKDRERARELITKNITSSLLSGLFNKLL